MSTPFTTNLKFDKGLDLKSPDEALAAGAARVLENLYLDRFDVPSKLPGYAKYNSVALSQVAKDLHEFEKSDGTKTFLVIEGDRLQTSVGDGSFTEIEDGLGTARYEFVTARNRAYYVNGVLARSTDGASGRPMGLEPPLSGMAVATSGAGVLSGTHHYAVSFLFDGFQESSQSASITITGLSNEATILTSIPTGVAELNVTARKIYRTIEGALSGASYFLVTTIEDNVTTTFFDNIADADLGGASLTDVLPLTNGGSFLTPKYPEYTANRMWLANVGGDPDKVYPSDPLNPDQFRENTFFQINPSDGSPITALHAFQGNLLVFKRDSVSIIRGLNTGDVAAMVVETLINGLGCVDNRSIQTVIRNGIPVVMFADKAAIYGFSGNNFVRLSDAIEPLYKELGQVKATRGQDIDTIKADFDAGTKSATLSSLAQQFTTLDPSKIYTSDTDFGAGTLCSVTISANNIQYNAFTNGFASNITLFDDFSDGNLSADPAWSGTSIAVCSNQMRMTDSSDATVSTADPLSGRPFGQWQLTLTGTTGTVTGYEIDFIRNSAGTNAYRINAISSPPTTQLIRISNAGATILDSENTFDSNVIYKIFRDTSGSITVLKNGADFLGAVDTVHQGTSFTDFKIVGKASGGGFFNVDDVNIENIRDGVWTSAVHDTTTDFTSWVGVLTPARTLANGTIAYAVRTSSTAGAISAATYTDVLSGGTLSGESSANRFIQVRATIVNENVNNTTLIQSIKLDWTQTSTLDSATIDTALAAGPDGWDTFISSISEPGPGVTFDFRTAATVGALSAVAYTSVSNGGFPSQPEARFAQWRANLVSVASNLPVVDDVTVQWFTGAGLANRMASIFFDDLYVLSAQETGASSTNDILIIQDRRGRWTTSDIKANALVNFFDNMYIADTDVGTLFKWDKDVFTRDGVNVTSELDSGNISWVEQEGQQNFKFFRGWWLNIGDSSETFSVSINPDEAGFITDIDITGSDSTFVPFARTSVRAKLRLKHSGSGDFKLWATSPELKILPRRRSAR